MKRYRAVLLGLLITLFLPVTSNAQDTEFGAKGGFNFHTIYGVENSDAGLRLGYHLGGFADIGLSDAFSLRPELLFSLEGARRREEITNTVIRFSYYYFSIPIMARYSMEGLYFEGGPKIGLLLGGKTVSRNKESGDSRSSDLDMDGYRTAEFAFGFGGGYRLDNGLGFGLRFDLGLTGIRNYSDVTDQYRDEGDNPKNFGIQLTAGYAF